MLVTTPMYSTQTNYDTLRKTQKDRLSWASKNDRVLVVRNTKGRLTCTAVVTHRSHAGLRSLEVKFDRPLSQAKFAAAFTAVRKELDYLHRSYTVVK